MWHGNAEDWYSNEAGWLSFNFYAANRKPVLGAIMVLSVGKYGHAAFVESVTFTTVTVSEMNKRKI